MFSNFYKMFKRFGIVLVFGVLIQSCATGMKHIPIEQQGNIETGNKFDVRNESEGEKMENKYMEKYKEWAQTGTTPKGDMVLSLLDDELKYKRLTSKIESLSERGEYWKAYKTLIEYLSYCNASLQQSPKESSKIIDRLIDLIEKMREAIEETIQGIGGNGYSIGVSLPWGISISVSFPID